MKSWFWRRVRGAHDERVGTNKRDPGVGAVRRASDLSSLSSAVAGKAATCGISGGEVVPGPTEGQRNQDASVGPIGHSGPITGPPLLRCGSENRGDSGNRPRSAFWSVERHVQRTPARDALYSHRLLVGEQLVRAAPLVIGVRDA